MTESLNVMFNTRKCLAWLVLIDYILIGYYIYLATSLLYFDVFVVGLLIAFYNVLLVMFIVQQPQDFVSFEKDKHLVIPICFAVFLGCTIVVLTFFV